MLLKINDYLAMNCYQQQCLRGVTSYCIGLSASLSTILSDNKPKP